MLLALLLAAPTQISNVTLSDAETAAAAAATLSAAATAAATAVAAEGNGKKGAAWWSDYKRAAILDTHAW